MSSTIIAFIGGLAIGAVGSMVIILALFWAVKRILEYESILDIQNKKDNELSLNNNDYGNF